MAAVPANTRGEGVHRYLTRDSAGRTPPPPCGTPSTFFQDRNPASPPNPPWLPAPTHPDADTCTYPNPPSPPSISRASRSPQQQLLDPATYLQSLRSAQSPTARGGRRPMDFLSSFNFRDEEPARLDSQPCGSVEELQSRLRDAFGGKVSETRAERVATRLELAASVEMTIGAADGDGGRGLEGLSSLDPSLGGAPSTGVSGAADGGQPGRVVRVSEALMNQPADNPVLQRSIANQLVAGVGQVDGSEWAVREMSRATRDWVFSYVCKGSMQHWQRQHKSQAKPLVAEYSQREIDPLLASRPAFDCRGSLVISFSRNTRTVSIDYDHIPLHRTVSELASLFKPPPPRHPLPNTEKQAKQAKVPKTPRQPGSSRKKKKDATDETPAGEGASKPRKRKRKADAGAAGEQSQSQGAAGTQAGEDGNTAGQQQDGQAGQAAPLNSAAGLLVINVSPEEAERRRNVAMVMLQGAGVDPDSLSPEQFNIFANQSPELQKESLNMLVKYGAERLRIVHPGNKEGSAPPASSTSSAPATQSNIQGSSSGPVTTNELVLQTSTKKSRKKSQAANNDVEEENADSTAKKSRRKGPSKSRTACAQCKQRRVKCPRELPLCSGCREAGLICEYAPPRPKKQKSNAIVTTEDEQDENEEDEAGAEEQDETQLEDQQLQEDAEGYPDLADDSVAPQLPIGDGLGSNMGVPVPDWDHGHAPPSFFHTTAMGASEADSSQPPHQSTSVPLSNLILPAGRTYYPNISTPEIQDQTLTPPVAQEQRKKPAKAVTKGSGRNAAMRKALPNESHSSLHATGASEWTPSANPVTQAAAVVAAVVTSLQDPTPREPTYGMADSSRNNAWRPSAIPQTLDNAQQQAVAGASLQRTKTASPMNDGSRSRTAKHPKQGMVHKSPAAAYQSPNMAEQHHQAQQQQQQTAHGSGLQAPSGMAGSASYSSYDRYSSSRAPDASSNDRITYEPYSYQRDTNGATSYTGYSHSSHSTSTTTAATMPSAALPAADRTGSQAYGSYSNTLSRNTSHTNQSSHAGARGSVQAQDYGSNSSDLARSSRQTFNMRPGQTSMKQDRGYSAYPSQMQHQQQHTQQHTQQQHTSQHTQQASQQQAWYGFNSQSGGAFTSTGGHGSNYSWNMPGDS